MTIQSRFNVTDRHSPGDKVWMGEFPGTIARLYQDGPYEAARMYEVRLPGGLACICGSDLTPRQ